MYGVDSIEESCYQSWPHLTENNTTQLDIQVAHCTMQEYIHQMVAHGLQLMQQVVESERGNAQRTVRLVAAVRVDGLAPEVVPEKLRPRRLGGNITVFQYSGLVVVAETTFERIDVNSCSHHCAYGAAERVKKIGGNSHSYNAQGVLLKAGW